MLVAGRSRSGGSAATGWPAFAARTASVRVDGVCVCVCVGLFVCSCLSLLLLVFVIVAGVVVVCACCCVCVRFALMLVTLPYDSIAIRILRCKSAFGWRRFSLLPAFVIVAVGVVVCVCCCVCGWCSLPLLTLPYDCDSSWNCWCFGVKAFAMKSHSGGIGHAAHIWMNLRSA